MLAVYFLSALAALSSALPTGTQSTDDCSAPQDFMINGFSTFTPADSNPGTPSLSFRVENTSCSSHTILNPLTPKNCDDANISYSWDGKSLTLEEKYTACANPSTKAAVYGRISSIALNCYPVVSPYPLGDGTRCETPTGQISGEFTRNSPFP